MSLQRLACACCGYRTLEGARGEHETCPICFWRDDPMQLDDPHVVGGANTVSLVQAQGNYQRLGVSEARFADQARGIDLAEDERDPAWRPYLDALDAGGPASTDGLDRPRVYWLRPHVATEV